MTFENLIIIVYLKLNFMLWWKSQVYSYFVGMPELQIEHQKGEER